MFIQDRIRLIAPLIFIKFLFYLRKRQMETIAIIGAMDSEITNLKSKIENIEEIEILQVGFPRFFFVLFKK